jgi:hypothetical protein
VVVSGKQLQTSSMFLSKAGANIHSAWLEMLAKAKWSCLFGFFVSTKKKNILIDV